MRFFTKKLLINYCLLLALSVVGLGGLLVFNENKIQCKVASERLHEYRVSIGRFFQQQWVLNAVDWSAQHSVERESKLFADPETKCQRFFFNGEMLGGFGSCRVNKKIVDELKEGWQRCPRGNLVLKDSFHENDALTVITVRDNPNSYTVNDQGEAEIGINEKNIVRALPSLAMWLTIISIVFFGWSALIFFRKQRDRSLDRIHDFSKSSVDIKYLAYKMREIDGFISNKQMRQLSHQIECVSNLEQISLENPSLKKGKVKSYNLKKLIDEFCTGFFFERNRDDLFEMEAIDPKIHIKTNLNEFTRVLLNLFSNAYDAVHGVPHSKFKLSIISGTKEIRIIISNKYIDEEIKLAINKRRGRGINIMKNILKDRLSLIQSRDNLIASFSIPIDWEATCPELY